MNLTSNERLISLLLKTLQEVITPELTSSNAQAMSGIMQAILADMLKRETRTPTLLSDSSSRGRALAAEMSALLGESPALPVMKADHSIAFSDRLDEHAQLTAELARLAGRLAAQRGDAAFAQQQARISELLLQCAQWETWYYTEQNRPLPTPPTKPPQLAGPLTLETLLPFVRSQHADGDAVQITSFQSIPGGFGKQTSKFTLRDAKGNEQVLIARKNDPHPMLTNAVFIIEHEFHLVSAVSATGYIAPKPLWLGSAVDGVDAGFYVMECLPGKIPGSFLGGLGEGQSGHDSSAMLKDVARRLGELHAISIDTFADYIRACDDPGLLTDTVESCCRRQIDQWARYAEAEQVSSPYLSFLIDWLRQNVPQDSQRPLLLHGDFNIHNLLVENDRVSGVLDWECALFGAPEQDLAYIQPHVSQHIAWDEFLAAYHAGGGRALDHASMPFYLAFSSLKLHIAMLRATRNLQSGTNDDVRYAMVELGFGVRFMELGLAGAQGYRKV